MEFVSDVRLLSLIISHFSLVRRCFAELNREGEADGPGEVALRCQRLSWYVEFLTLRLLFMICINFPRNPNTIDDDSRLDGRALIVESVGKDPRPTERATLFSLQIVD